MSSEMGRPQMTAEAQRDDQSGARLLGVRAASKYLGVGRSTLYAWASAGRIPGAMHLGDRLLFDRVSLDGYISGMSASRGKKNGARAPRKR
jgi:excisionase family DNA binding protein